MKAQFVLALATGVAIGVASSAQTPPDTTSAAPPSQAQSGQGGNGQAGNGQRGGGRGWGGGMGMGRGVMGTVTEVAADHYSIKTEAGENYTVHYSANTRLLKQPPGGRGSGAGTGEGSGSGQGEGQRTPPQAIKATDIKVGDAIAAMGDIDATAKSVGATVVMQIDPERAKQMREMEANYGKTWLMGKVTAIDGVKVILMGAADNTAHEFVADENTTFRKRRDPITLADIQVGDTVRVEGGVKGGTFLATAVNAMGPPPGGTANVPRTGPPPAQPQ
jgi:preprotein translocase subunit YajC